MTESKDGYPLISNNLFQTHPQEEKKIKHTNRTPSLGWFLQLLSKVSLFQNCPFFPRPTFSGLPPVLFEPPTIKRSILENNIENVFSGMPVWWDEWWTRHGKEGLINIVSAFRWCLQEWDLTLLVKLDLKTWQNHALDFVVWSTIGISGCWYELLPQTLHLGLAFQHLI